MSVDTKHRPAWGHRDGIGFWYGRWHAVVSMRHSDSETLRAMPVRAGLSEMNPTDPYVMAKAPRGEVFCLDPLDGRALAAALIETGDEIEGVTR
jgi:hypothetical protein